MFCFVLLCANVQCYTAVGDGRWDKAIEDFLLDFVDKQLFVDRVACVLTWQGGGAVLDGIE